MSDCVECGQPLERVDDFWICDNPDCPQKKQARAEQAPLSEDEMRELEHGPAAARAAELAPRMVAEIRRLRDQLARRGGA